MSASKHDYRTPLPAPVAAGPRVQNTYDRPTDKQTAYAESLARKAGYGHLSRAVKDCFGKQPVGGLNRAAMSELINWLQGKTA